MNLLRNIERSLLAVGVLLLAIFVIAKLHSNVASKAAVEKFSAVQAERARLKVPEESNFELWSTKRVNAYRETLLKPVDEPMALLRVPRLKIEVPVIEGTDEFALNRGVGWIAGTSHPGQPGNVGIAGHRDGFFRALKDVKIGDSIEIATLDGTQTFSVDEIEIVRPEDRTVLRPRSRPSVTLVTCYPFYFVGDAPQRFIVHASIDNNRSQDKGSLNSHISDTSDRRNLNE